jgi:hypothetical protein
MPDTLPFARWWAQEADIEEGTIETNIAAMIDDGKLQIWDSEFSISVDGRSVHEAAARAARDVLAHGLQTSLIGVGCQID